MISNTRITRNSIKGENTDDRKFSLFRGRQDTLTGNNNNGSGNKAAGIGRDSIMNKNRNQSLFGLKGTSMN